MNEIETIKNALGIITEQPRVFRVTELLGNNKIRIVNDKTAIIATGDYPVGADVIVSGGNIIGLVGQSRGTFKIQ